MSDQRWYYILGSLQPHDKQWISNCLHHSNDDTIEPNRWQWAVNSGSQTGSNQQHLPIGKIKLIWNCQFQYCLFQSDLNLKDKINHRWFEEDRKLKLVLPICGKERCKRMNYWLILHEPTALLWSTSYNVKKIASLQGKACPQCSAHLSGTC